MARFFRRKKGAAPEPAEGVEGAEAVEAPEQAEAVVEAETEAEALKSVEHAVERTRRTWFSRIGGMFRRGLDDELWDELEESAYPAFTSASRIEITREALSGPIDTP